MSKVFVGHPDGTMDALLYEEDSINTMSAADWNADYAHTQAAWSLSDLPSVSPMQRIVAGPGRPRWRR